MKVGVFFVSLKDVEDAVHEKNTNYLETLLDQAMTFTNNGGRVVIQREYSNAQPDLVDVFITSNEIETWKAKLLKDLAK